MDGWSSRAKRLESPMFEYCFIGRPSQGSVICHVRGLWSEDKVRA